jgi:hypothetical protein
MRANSLLLHDVGQGDGLFIRLTLDPDRHLA